LLTCKQHGQSVDAYSQSGSRRHAILQRAQEIVVHSHRFVIAFLCQFQLLFKAFKLIERVVQLGIGIGYFLSVDIEFKALYQPGLLAVFLGERA